jgi:hypothetical protein
MNTGLLKSNNTKSIMTMMIFPVGFPSGSMKKYKVASP